MKEIVALIFLCTLWSYGWSQGFSNWIVGDTSDVAPADFQPGLVLAGGGGDNDQAMQWMLSRADGGDVLVIRASGSDGYNDYFFDQLGVAVNSVETIRFDDASAANDTYVLRRIEEAEVLFIAGGDQYKYYAYWKDTPVETAIQSLIHEKGITVGGTSAGMAILSHGYYAPSSLGIYSSEALEDPYHPYTDVLGYGDFLRPPFTEFTITDTHFDQRERAGRTLVFLARLTHDRGFPARGIAANEYTAVCVNGSGLARVFGEYPQYEEDQVYFLRVNCPDPIEPETCESEMPLHWNRNQQAVKVYKVPGTIEGDHTFDLTDWVSGNGGGWEDWYVAEGILERVPDAEAPDCMASGTASRPMPERLSLFPNPFRETVHVLMSVDDPSATVQVVGMDGQLYWWGMLPVSGQLKLSFLPEGVYQIQVVTSRQILSSRVIKIQ